LGKHSVEVQERAYDLYMVQRTPFHRVVQMLRDEFGSFSSGTLTKWSHDADLDWDGRYAEYRLRVAQEADKRRVKDITPIATAIQEIREDTYQQLRIILQLGEPDKDGNVKSPIDSKNLGKVLEAFVKLADLEMRRIGDGRRNQVGVVQVITVIFDVIEKTPGVGPVFAAHRQQITEAIFEEIKSE
jgi:hypothetical protein